MKRRLILAAACLPLSGTAAAGEYGVQKVVYDINSGDDARHRAALRNIGNHLTAVGDDKLHLFMVLRGLGVKLLQTAVWDSTLQSQLAAFKERGVRIRVCESSLERHNLDYRTELFDVRKEDLVKSGVAEIAELQMQGYTYIKP